MMTFITKNHKELVLFEKKYEIVGNKTIQFTSTNGAPLSYTQDQYDWVIYTTMLYSTIRVDRSGTILYDRTPSLIINNKHDLIRGYKLSCTNTTDSSSYYGGVSSELTGSRAIPSRGPCVVRPPRSRRVRHGPPSST